MRLWLRVLPCFFLCFGLAFSTEAAEAPDISAPYAVLMEVSTGQILYARNPQEKRPPASTTKILTAVLAIELGRLDSPVQVSRHAASTPGASLYLAPETVWRLEDLLKGALISSGNDACVALAEHLAGSEETFAWLMNRKAGLLGAYSSHFVNPHGLPDDEHYSTAYDLALLSRYALSHPLFRQIVATRRTTVQGSDGPRELYNTNRLLDSYEGADGIKTGTTVQAGQCLVASATRGGRQLIAVVLRSFDRYKDVRDLLDYGFHSFHLERMEAGEKVGKIYVPNGGQKELTVVLARGVAWSVPADEVAKLEKRVIIPAAIKAPVKKGQILGALKLLYAGEEVAASPLVAAEEVSAEKGIFRFLGR
ncbi:MAG: D-alanyl-D-alanine carboxypeptidase family protein [Moorellaceae bacterium]